MYTGYRLTEESIRRCEKFSDRHAQSGLVSGVWETGDQAYVDGLGKTTNEEKIMMESSSGPLAERMDHTISDATKLACLCRDALRVKLIDNLDASFKTAQEAAAFGIRCVVQTITHSRVCLYDKDHWLLLELRSAKLPKQWVELAHRKKYSN